MSKILNYLYLSSKEEAQNNKFLKNSKIIAIISIGNDINNDLNLPLYKINEEDYPNTSLDKYFNDTNNFIIKHKKNGSILVHCSKGVSRSATIILAFLINNNKMSLLEAFNFLKNKRNIIHPNHGFIKQLGNYEMSINNINKPSLTSWDYMNMNEHDYNEFVKNFNLK